MTGGFRDFSEYLWAIHRDNALAFPSECRPSHYWLVGLPLDTHRWRQRRQMSNA
jgi:hypothetical protein